MTNNNLKVRRKDREQDEKAFLEKMLTETASCSIAYMDGERPANHVAFFAYDKQAQEIVFHFSRHGYGGSALVQGTDVCISVYKVGDLYTAQKAVDFGSEYQSVIVYGKLKIEETEDQKTKSMQLFFNKFFAHVNKSTYTTFTPVDIKPIHVARVPIEKWFGKEHRTPDFATGSFPFPEMFADFSR